jgi:hypothetical protein
MHLIDSIQAASRISKRAAKSAPWRLSSTLLYSSIASPSTLLLLLAL